MTTNGAPARSRLKLGVNLGPRSAERLRIHAQLAESLGFDSLWSGEAYGTDAVVPLTWAAANTTRIRLGSAIMQMPARTPAMTAMTALTLHQLSGGRFVLGLGTSGPQVVEGWHGLPFDSPIARTEEYIAIVRQIFAAEGRVKFAGTHYQLPYTGPGSTGIGKAMPSGFKPARIPIMVAAIGPRNVALATRVADGLLPMLWNPYRAGEVYGDVIARAAAGGFEIAPTVSVAVGDDIEACRDEVRPLLAMYIGGMGAKNKNFYNDVIRRYGYEQAAEQVQTLYLAGKREEAVRALPSRLVDELALVGPRGHIAEQLTQWQASGASTLILATTDPDAMRMVAELVL